jgi:hypothetical protein
MCVRKHVSPEERLNSNRSIKSYRANSRVLVAIRKWAVPGTVWITEEWRSYHRLCKNSKIPLQIIECQIAWKAKLRKKRQCETHRLKLDSTYASVCGRTDFKRRILLNEYFITQWNFGLQVGKKYFSISISHTHIFCSLFWQLFILNRGILEVRWSTTWNVPSFIL